MDSPNNAAVSLQIGLGEVLENSWALRKSIIMWITGLVAAGLDAGAAVSVAACLIAGLVFHRREPTQTPLAALMTRLVLALIWPWVLMGSESGQFLLAALQEGFKLWYQ